MSSWFDWRLWTTLLVLGMVGRGYTGPAGYCEVAGVENVTVYRQSFNSDRGVWRATVLNDGRVGVNVSVSGGGDDVVYMWLERGEGRQVQVQGVSGSGGVVLGLPECQRGLDNFLDGRGFFW